MKEKTDWYEPSFNLEVLITTRPNLRDREMQSQIGYVFLGQLFDSEEILKNEDVYLEYPERWLNILEQRALYHVIEKRCPNIKSLKILTHSVYIIQCTPNSCAKIIDTTEGYPETADYTIGQRYCPEQKQTGELTVFKMSK